MAYAIIRIKKQKSGNLGAVGQHNRRETPQPHTNPDGHHEVLIGAHHANTSDAVNARLKQLGINKHRKDAVVAVEIMATASPEYFRPNNPEKWGEWDDSRMKKWAELAIKHLQKKYGDNLVEAVIHLDEATPHVHAIVVPAMVKEKKARRTKAQIEAGEPAKTTKVWTLCCKNMFNRVGLRDLQSDYAKDLEPLGLKRGMRRSRAKHEPLKNYYSATGTEVSMPTFQTAKIPTPPVLNRENWAEKLTKTIAAHYKKQFENLKTKAENILKKAHDYERRYKREKARSSAYTALNSTPQELREKIEIADKSFLKEECLKLEIKNRDTEIKSLKKENIELKRELNNTLNPNNYGV